MPPLPRQTAIESCYVIPGWCFPRELGAIYDLVSDRRCHVEIGCFCGRSLYAAVGALGHGARAIAIDPLQFRHPDQTFPLPSATWPRAVWAATCEAIREVRPDVQLDWMAQPALDAAISFTGQVDSLYHDGEHHYAELLGDLESWYPHVRSGGVVFGHDYSAASPGVIDAVEEFFGTRGLEVEVISQTRLWVHRKP